MKSWAKFTLDTFKNIYGLSELPPINYGHSDEPGILIKNQTHQFFKKNQLIDAADVGWISWKGERIPMLFSKNTVENPLVSKSDQLIINYDILGSAFYFLSGWHEYQLSKTLNFERYSYYQSLIRELGVVHLPVVNYYFDLLKTAIEQYTSKHLSPARDQLGNIGIALTHDIDNLYSGWLEDGFAALKQGKWITGLKVGVNRIRGWDTRFNLHEIDKFEDKKNIKASFYFLAREGYYNGIEHADYTLREKNVRQVIAYLHEHGHEIGIHGSKGAHIYSKSLKEEIEQLDHEVLGGRFHYLNFNRHKTPLTLEKANLFYDTTLGFAEHIGFRNGIAHPFYLFDLESMQKTNVLEIPLLVMDATLRQQDYMGLSPSEAYEHVEPLIEEVIKFSGAVSILWHNGYFSDLKYAGWKKLLENIIDYTIKNDGTLCPAKHIYQIFTNGKITKHRA